MTAKNYEKTCARFVQEAAGVSYQAALNWVRRHEKEHPEQMPAETRAMRIIRAAEGVDVDG
jgi:hypothetical protein